MIRTLRRGTAQSACSSHTQPPPPHTVHVLPNSFTTSGAMLTNWVTHPSPLTPKCHDYIAPEGRKTYCRNQGKCCKFNSQPFKYHGKEEPTSEARSFLPPAVSQFFFLSFRSSFAFLFLAPVFYFFIISLYLIFIYLCFLPFSVAFFFQLFLCIFRSLFLDNVFLLSYFYLIFRFIVSLLCLCMY